MVLTQEQIKSEYLDIDSTLIINHYEYTVFAGRLSCEDCLTDQCMPFLNTDMTAKEIDEALKIPENMAALDNFHNTHCDEVTDKQYQDGDMFIILGRCIFVYYDKKWRWKCNETGETIMGHLYDFPRPSVIDLVERGPVAMTALGVESKIVRPHV